MRSAELFKDVKGSVWYSSPELAKNDSWQKEKVFQIELKPFFSYETIFERFRTRVQERTF
jgi:hypothetical protein